MPGQKFGFQANLFISLYCGCDTAPIKNTVYQPVCGYYAFYRCGVNGPEFIEKIVRDPITLYWGHVEAGKDGRTVTEEEAMLVINSYQRIELDLKPFTKYPLK